MHTRPRGLACLCADACDNYLGQALAFTSKGPGKTQQFNYFIMNNNTENAFYLVDMPGMGYAKASARWAGLAGWLGRCFCFVSVATAVRVSCTPTAVDLHGSVRLHVTYSAGVVCIKGVICSASVRWKELPSGLLQYPYSMLVRSSCLLGCLSIRTACSLAGIVAWAAELSLL